VPDASRYAQRLAQARPELFQSALAAIEQPCDAAAMRAWLDTQRSPTSGVETRAARLRQQVMLRVLLRDLSGRAPLAKWSQHDDLAELCSATPRTPRRLAASAARHAMAPQAQELIVVGMASWAARTQRLSDIDLIFVYPEEGETACTGATCGRCRTTNISPASTQAHNALADITEDGQVFASICACAQRDSGPLACSFDALENYFIAEGANGSVTPGSRRAWLPRAQPGAGGELARELATLAGRSYSASISISAHLRDALAACADRAEVARRELRTHQTRPGGIREIEFIARPSS